MSGPNHINIEASKSAAYALVKYAAEARPGCDFRVCMKVYKGGILRIWIEDQDGEETDDYQTGDKHGNKR